MKTWPELGERESQVLASLVYEYIATGVPVGSRTLSQHYELGVSPATIRSTMGTLEELGLASQPHTSAGRVPTDRGIRLFVEVLMVVRDLTPAEREHIRIRVGDLPSTPDPWHETGRLLSDMTRQAAIVLTPRPDAMVLAQIRFVPLSSGEFLALLVGESGIVLHRPFPVAMAPSPAQLDRIHNYLNEIVPGKTLSEARAAIERETDEARQTLDELRAQALELGRGALGGVGEDPSLIVQGQAKLVVDHRVADVDRVRQIMTLLEDQDTLSELLDATIAADGAQLVIGTEHPATGEANCAVVAASYAQAGGSRGSLAVVGPRSMDYCKVLPLVEFMARMISGSSSRAA